MSTKNQGFTLVEAMVTLAIIGVLGAIAYPSYLSHMERTRRTDCQGVLTNFAIAMERHFAATNSYRAAAAGGNDTGTPAVTTFLTQCPIDGSTKFYNLTIEAADDTSYRLRATPINGQAGTGMIELDSAGRKAWDANASNAIDPNEFTWNER